MLVQIARHDADIARAQVQQVDQRIGDNAQRKRQDVGLLRDCHLSDMV